MKTGSDYFLAVSVLLVSRESSTLLSNAVGVYPGTPMAIFLWSSKKGSWSIMGTQWSQEFYDVLEYESMYGSASVCGSQDINGELNSWQNTGSLFTMTSSNGNIFRVTGPWCAEFTGHRWHVIIHPYPGVIPTKIKKHIKILPKQVKLNRGLRYDMDELLHSIVWVTCYYKSMVST